jgi:hypothetical protein
MSKKNELLRVPHDAIPMVKFAKKRDVMLHAACTIMGTTEGIEIIGQKDEEICQFAVHIPARQMPKKESHIRRAFEEMCEMTLNKMRSHGLLR